jgi:segregation and condensation protein B
MDSWKLKAKIEALLTGLDRPVTVQAMAQCLDASEQELDAALQEYEADLMAADRGVQVKHRPHGVRLEMKPEFADLIGVMIPEKRPKPISSQALETLAIVALKQPVTIGDVNAIRGIESAGTMQTLRNRNLIARATRLGPRREKLWRTTPLFLETFGLASLDELYQEGRKEQIFAPVFNTGFGEDAGDESTKEGQDNLSVEAVEGDEGREEDELVA